MEAKKQHTPIQISCQEGRIFEVSCGNRTSLSLDEAQEIQSTLKQLGADESCMILLSYHPDADVQTMNHFDADYFSVRALALHNPNVLSQRMYKLLVKISSSDCPIGLFTQHDEAVHWLKAFAA